MEPVDPTEAPNYYKVINEPMGKFINSPVASENFC